jgi:Fic family protein
MEWVYFRITSLAIAQQLRASASGHVQFETIHPYLDGNSRIGRLLITLLLEHWKLLSAPLLYLSLFFKRHRAEYYRLLGEVRRSGDWEAWMAFFLEGVETTGWRGAGS